MSIVLRCLGRHPRAATTALLIGLFAIGSITAMGEVGPPRDKIVALGFDVSSNALIKAYPRALYRSGNDARDWEPIALPKAIQENVSSFMLASATPPTTGSRLR